jgi:hypothetical protein
MSDHFNFSGLRLHNELASDFGCPRANLSFFTADREQLIESALNLMALEPKYISRTW